MMKLAIAGTNGFAQYLAHYLETTTVHQFVILSRKPNSGLTAKGWQVIQTTYESISDLTYLLTGVDLVISTICGNAQLSLIEAAAAASVRTFVPSEFRDSPTTRAFDDPADDGRRAAIERLRYHFLQGSMHYTIFTCGLFYERFAPGGLSTSQIDVEKVLGDEGEYLVNFRRCQASLPESSGLLSLPPQHEEIYICLTSARDVARFVVASLALRMWPQELKFRAQRLSVREIIVVCEKVRGLPFQIQTSTPSSIQESLALARIAGDRKKEIQYAQQLYTGEGRFDFTDTNLESMVDITCETFEEWLTGAWSSVL